MFITSEPLVLSILCYRSGSEFNSCHGCLSVVELLSDLENLKHATPTVEKGIHT